MVVDISKIAGDEGATLSYSGEIKYDDFDFPVYVSGTVKNYSNQYVISCDIKTTCIAQCARCLEEIKKEVETSFEEMIGSEDCPESLKIVQNTIDIDEAVYTSVLFSLSQKFLCKEDCKGLCFVCGTNLNEKECKCDKEVTDPRFDVLKKLLQ
ncbi:MAG: DUF177 domain-containing protein [Ruminococcaceae bacterium]|nr:DUF177 domain-containing protein [Oscillospiraceae bacterium]